MEKLSDAWIFVSHSVEDLDAVRRIRDEFELLGANPILFFLKQRLPTKKLNGLIKREIGARNFFLLCDSESARESDWVQLEVDYVRAQQNKKVETIDLSWPWDKQRDAVHRLLKEATVFLSYSTFDQERIQPYVDFLRKEDFALRGMPDDISVEDDWQARTKHAIHEAAIFGFFVLFASRKWIESAWAEGEFFLYLQLAGSSIEDRPIVFLLDPLDPSELPDRLINLPTINAARLSFEDSCLQLRRALGL